MALTLKNGNYIKIKDNSITATELEYYQFKDKATRDKLTPQELVKERTKKLRISIDMTVKGDPTKSMQDNLKTIAYEKMKVLSQEQSVITTTIVKPFDGAIDI